MTDEHLKQRDFQALAKAAYGGMLAGAGTPTGSEHQPDAGGDKNGMLAAEPALLVQEPLNFQGQNGCGAIGAGEQNGCGAQRLRHGRQGTSRLRHGRQTAWPSYECLPWPKRLRWLSRLNACKGPAKS